MDLLDIIHDYVKSKNFRGLLSKINHNTNLKESAWDLVNKNFNNIDNLSEGLYLFINNLTEKPTCVGCGAAVSYKNLNVGYFTWCSSKCVQCSSNTKEKIKNTNLKKRGVEHHTKTDEHKQYIAGRCSEGSFGFGSKAYKKYLANNNVENVSQIPIVHSKIMKTIKNRTPLKQDLIKQKQKETLFKRYGVINAYQLARKFIYHNYQLPSGKIIKLQGYEPVAMSILLERYDETEIIFNRNEVPKILYKYENKKRIFYPDFFIPKDNLIIEVKSEWTYKIKKAQNLKKLKAAQAKYDAYIWICLNDELLKIIN